MLRKVRFPRMVVPLSVSLTAVFNLAMNFIAVFVFALANGVDPKPSWLELIPIISLYIIFASGTGMLLSALYVQYRDIQPIWDVTAQVLFYCSPIIYLVSFFKSSGLEKVAILNPIAALNTQMGHAVIGYVELHGVYAAEVWADRVSECRRRCRRRGPPSGTARPHLRGVRVGVVGVRP